MSLFASHTGKKQYNQKYLINYNKIIKQTRRLLPGCGGGPRIVRGRCGRAASGPTAPAATCSHTVNQQTTHVTQLTPTRETSSNSE